MGWHALATHQQGPALPWEAGHLGSHGEGVVSHQVSPIHAVIRRAGETGL